MWSRLIKILSFDLLFIFKRPSFSFVNLCCVKNVIYKNMGKIKLLLWFCFSIRPQNKRTTLNKIIILANRPTSDKPFLRQNCDLILFFISMKNANFMIMIIEIIITWRCWESRLCLLKMYSFAYRWVIHKTPSTKHIWKSFEIYLFFSFENIQAVCGPAVMKKEESYKNNVDYALLYYANVVCRYLFTRSK